MIRTYLRSAQRLWTRVPRYATSTNPVPPAEREDNKMAGLNLLINRVYLTTGASFLATLSATHLASTIPYLMVNPFVCFGVGGLLSTLGYVSAWYMKPQEITVYEAARTFIKTTNSWPRILMYSLGCTGMGIAFLPFANMASAMSPYFLTNMMALTIGSFGGASLLITLMPKLKLFREIGLLGAALGGLLMMAGNNHLISSVYGQHFMSNWMQAFDTYGGVALFFFMIAYNTKLCKVQYDAGKADHLAISMQFLYDFLAFLKKTVTGTLRSLVGRGK